MNITKASVDDLDIIGILAQAIWFDHYIPIIGEEQVVYMLNKLYHVEALRKQINDGQVFYMISEGEDPLGFAAIEERGEGLFLNKFYILTQEQGKGIGQKVFEELLSFYKDKKWIKLQVNRQNYKSINFCFKLGFKIEQVADFDIGDGYFMNDFVMIKNL